MGDVVGVNKFVELILLLIEALQYLGMVLGEKLGLFTTDLPQIDVQINS